MAGIIGHSLDAAHAFVIVKRAQLSKIKNLSEIEREIQYNLDDIEFCVTEVLNGQDRAPDGEYYVERMDNDVKSTDFLALEITRRKSNQN